MKKEFVDYLKSIGITTKALFERIEEICEFCSEICPDEIVDIFVDEHIKEDGTREYEDLSFFSDKYSVGARQFLTKDDFIIAPIKRRIYSYIIQKQDYDFKKATEKSRLKIQINLGPGGVSGNFKASKENCGFLRDIILKYIKPNLKE